MLSWFQLSVGGGAERHSVDPKRWVLSLLWHSESCSERCSEHCSYGGFRRSGAFLAICFRQAVGIGRFPKFSGAVECGAAPRTRASWHSFLSPPSHKFQDLGKIAQPPYF